jgi:ribose transport system ATP-binding protein
MTHADAKPAPAAHPLVLELRGVSKRYPGTLALDGVNLDVRTAEVHALLGENGAGKSTLVKLIAGTFSDYTGQVILGGREVALHSPAAAKALGIEMIHQELSLARPLSIAENLLAGRLPTKFGLLDRKAIRAESRRCLDKVGLQLDPDVLVEDISQHEAQLVEIAKALGNNPRILVMDEPTSALSRQEVNRLFTIVHKLRDEGLAIIYISHHLPELREIADRVTVLRDGRKVATENMADVTSGRLVDMMVGRSVSDLYAHRQTKPGDELLKVDRLSRFGYFHRVSLTLRRGEILGLAGLSGAGRSELARSICGIDPIDAGDLTLNGVPLPQRNYQAAIRDGFAYLTEDRKTQGLALRLTVAENTVGAIIPRLSRGGVFNPKRGDGLVRSLIARLQTYPPDPALAVANMSGGNQQKVLLAKWLATDPKVLILDEPTRGVDVGAKVVIHRAIAEAADRGVGIILISSDLPEMVGLCDRIVVLRKGHLIGQLPKGDMSEETVLMAANGEGKLLPP